MPSGDRVDTDTLVSRDAAVTRTASSRLATVAPVLPFLQRGASIGRFLLLERIGEGGMGAVWTAYDGDLDRKVALKLVRPDRAEDDDVRARMVREAQALARLAHPNVVTVHEVGLHEGNVYLAMEYVEGETLKAWMAREPPGSGERLGRMIGIMQQAGSGLAAAHAAGMVHRDFKPANVIVGADGRVRVVDFGLARAQVPGDAPEELVATYRNEVLRSSSGGGRVQLHETVTQTGAFIGTPRYMSPEQFEGRAIDARSDVFSFATVLYEATYGRPPWQGATASSMYSEMLDGPPPTPESTEAPAWLTKVIRRGLSPKASQRYATMLALLEALALPAERGGARRPRRRIFLGAAAVVSGLMAGLWIAQPREVDDPCATARGRITNVWNERERARIAAVFTATGAPYADTMIATVATELDDYADDWANAAETACRSAPERSSCLDLRHTELGDLVVLLADADAATVERALDAATALTPISWCTRERGTRLAEDDARVGALRADLSRAKSLGRIGRLQEARRLGRDVADMATRLGMPALRAQALLQIGSSSPDTAEARQSLQDAFWLALGATEDEIAVATAIELLERSNTIEDATVWRRHAQVLLARGAATPELLGSLSIALGKAAMNRGENDLAIEYHTSALRTLEGQRGPLDLVVLSAAHGLALAYSQASMHDESNAQLHRVLEGVHARLGSSHPRAAMLHTDIAANELARHAFASAERELRTALAIYADNPADDPLPLSNTRRTLGEVLLWSGRVQDGRIELQAALTGLPQPPSGALAANVLRAIGTAHLLENQPERSLVFFRQSLEMEEHRMGSDSAPASITLNRMAQAFDALGDLDAAISATQRAAAILLRTGDRLGAALQYSNLGVLESKHGQHSHVISVCRRAIRLYEGSTAPTDPRLAFPLRVMSLSLIELGRAADAVAPLERALLLHQPNSYDAAERPKTMLALARAIWASAGDRVRARRLGTEALAELAASDRRDSVEFVEVSQWLGRHPP